MKQGLLKIYQGLEEHVKLQDNLRTQYDDIHKLHDNKTKEKVEDVKQDTSYYSNQLIKLEGGGAEQQPDLDYDFFDAFSMKSVKQEGEGWSYDDYENSVANIKVEADYSGVESDNFSDYENELKSKMKGET